MSTPPIKPSDEELRDKLTEALALEYLKAKDKKDCKPVLVAGTRIHRLCNIGDCANWRTDWYRPDLYVSVMGERARAK